MRRSIFPGSKISWGSVLCWFLGWTLTLMFLRLRGRTPLSYGFMALMGLLGVVLQLVIAFIDSRFRKRN